MTSLKKFLSERGYTRIPLRITKTNHIEITAKINGVKGCFILDTGASNTCVSFDSIDHFKLSPENSDVKAAGAGGRGMETQIAKKNRLEIGKWKRQKIILILFNMTHVNAALVEHNGIPVNGIIGADVLKKSKAIIDYNKKFLYLK